MRSEFQPERSFVIKTLTDKEKLALEKLDKKFNELANLDSPVFFTDEESLLMRKVLEASGATLHEFLSKEALDSLLDTQFRAIGHGRGFGVICILGMERTKKAMGLCDRLSVGEPRFKSELSGMPTEDSRSRGHYHLLADLISVAYLDKEQRKEIIRRMNRRLWKGAIAQAKGNQERILIINSNFERSNICEEPNKETSNICEKPNKSVARALPKNIYPIWMAITGRKIVERLEKK